jgi:hypothetical protein
MYFFEKDQMDLLLFNYFKIILYVDHKYPQKGWKFTYFCIYTC